MTTEFGSKAHAWAVAKKAAIVLRPKPIRHRLHGSVFGDQPIKQRRLIAKVRAQLEDEGVKRVLPLMP